MNTSCQALVVPSRLTHPVHIRPVELDPAALQRVAAGEVGFISSKDWHAYPRHLIRLAERLFDLPLAA